MIRIYSYNKKKKIFQKKIKFVIDNEKWILYCYIANNKTRFTGMIRGKEDQMGEIVRILMKRDGLTKQEAIETVKEVREMIQEAVECGDYDEVEDIMYSELGLEMDYIFAFI